jgi:hypothetical protein
MDMQHATNKEMNIGSTNTEQMSAMQPKPSTFEKLFLSHPEAVGETYLTHAIFAFGFSLKLFAAAFAALIHAIVPALFDKAASTIVRSLYERTHNRGR